MQYSWHVIHPAAFSAESHGQPQKLYGWSDGRGESCPRGQNFGKIQPEVEIKIFGTFQQMERKATHEYQYIVERFNDHTSSSWSDNYLI